MSRLGHDDGDDDEWVVPVRCVPQLRFRDQMVAFMMSSHPRCGRDSPASSLTSSHNTPLVTHLANKLSRGCAVIRSLPLDTNFVIGVSDHTLGVTTLFRRWWNRSAIAWMDATHCLTKTRRDDGSLRTAVADTATGRCADVPGVDHTLAVSSLAARGKWIVDYNQWRVWKVTMEDEDGGEIMGGLPMVSQPRRVRPWWRFGSEAEQGNDARQRESLFSLNLMVGDGFMDVWRRSPGVDLYAREHYLVDVERAFETGEMVPVDTVRVAVPRRLDSTICFSHCFWASKRVVVSGATVYELMGSGELRKGMAHQCAVWDFSSRFAKEPTVITLAHCEDECDRVRIYSWGGLLIAREKSQVHVVDPSSGVQLFTLSATNGAL
ncbi:hypothetical protein Pelo_14797 [Pelomyxa schiedti]|nr:hypothetical protein Pelo_14797 [Pelomyxa schiedti]